MVAGPPRAVLNSFSNLLPATPGPPLSLGLVWPWPLRWWAGACWRSPLLLGRRSLPAPGVEPQARCLTRNAGALAWSTSGAYWPAAATPLYQAAACLGLGFEAWPLGSLLNLRPCCSPHCGLRRQKPRRRGAGVLIGPAPATRSYKSRNPPRLIPARPDSWLDWRQFEAGLLMRPGCGWPSFQKKGSGSAKQIEPITRPS